MKISSKFRMAAVGFGLAVCSTAVVHANKPVESPHFPQPNPISAHHQHHMDMDSGVVYEEVDFIQGTQYWVDSFKITTDTTNTNQFYRATLTDFSFPETFDHLGFTVTSATQSFGQATVSGGGQSSFDFDATPGHYYASTFGSLMGSGPNVGLYGVQIALVPEMEVWAMLLAGMGLIGYQLKKRRSQNLAV